jgi:hypothetical protein
MAFGFDDVLGMIGLALSSVLGGGGNSQAQSSGVEPMDVYSRLKATLGPMGVSEEELARLQQMISQQFGQMSMGQDTSLPPELRLSSLAAGNVPSAMEQNIRQASYGSMQSGIDQALKQAQDYAMSKGMGLSSIQQTAGYSLMQPMLAQANQLYGQMMNQGMGQMQDLRAREIANRLALGQESNTALNRLTQLRTLEGTRENLQMNRFPGGLPGYAYGAQGAPPPPGGAPQMNQSTGMPMSNWETQGGPALTGSMDWYRRGGR